MIYKKDKDAIAAHRKCMPIAKRDSVEYSCLIYENWFGYDLGRAFKGSEFGTGKGSNLPNALRFFCASGFYHTHPYPGYGYFSDGDYVASNLMRAIFGSSFREYMGSYENEIFHLETNNATRNIETGEIINHFNYKELSNDCKKRLSINFLLSLFLLLFNSIYAFHFMNNFTNNANSSADQYGNYFIYAIFITNIILSISRHYKKTILTKLLSYLIFLYLCINSISFIYVIVFAINVWLIGNSISYIFLVSGKSEYKN